MHTATFPRVTFQGQLRPSQAEVVDIARRKLGAGKRRLHIVAPPGAGKTVLGLYLWAECVQRPALVLSPNSAIQAQWADRCSLFACDGHSLTDQQVSTDPQTPGLLTSLTYQSVTLPVRKCEDTDLAATALWVDRLIEQEHADTPEAANQWIDDLKHRSPDYFQQRLAGWRKQARDTKAIEGQAIDLLHDSSRETLHRLRDAGVGVVILDECHHLLGHWGRVLSAANDILDNPVVIGLTATPPDRCGQKPEDVARYDDYFGPIDYEVPVPAVVRDGYLAPYQDLVWFVRPTEKELRFVSQVDSAFRQLVDELSSPRSADAGAVPPLQEWVFDTLKQFRLPAAICSTWKEFERRDSAFADAARVFLDTSGVELPENVPPVHGFLKRTFLRNNQTPADLSPDVLTTVLDRYIRHGLRRSSNEDDRRLCRTAIDRLRLLGRQITETGSRACASPITRILGYTRSKAAALIPILSGELDQLEENLRAVVITDYEKSSAVSADVSHILDEEAGGAISAFREIVYNPVTNALDPILLTGSTVLIDHDLADLFFAAAEHWLALHSYDVTLEFADEEAFHVVKGRGSDWCPRVYIQLVTQLFQDGITRCLVGTRALLGEGWDASRINVLIDLTTATTSMTVNQLRGRSIRLDPAQPQKVANNWDVVCIAPEFTRGLDDYHRFCQKHQTIYGVTDDGAIEKGVGHVHAALNEMHPEGLEQSAAAFNSEMLRRSACRAHARKLWKIGSRYSGRPVKAVEVLIPSDGVGDGFVSGVGESSTPWTVETLARALATTVVKSLKESKQLTSSPSIVLTLREGCYVRIYLQKATEDDTETFAACLSELMSPFRRPRYIVPRYVFEQQRAPLTGWVPAPLGRFFESRRPRLLMYHAVPLALARNKSLVEIFERHWNENISDGEAVFALQGQGQQLVKDARQTSMMPSSVVETRECFL